MTLGEHFREFRRRLVICAASVFVAAAIAMWLGVKREDLVKAGTKEADASDPNDPNRGAVV